MFCFEAIKNKILLQRSIEIHLIIQSLSHRDLVCLTTIYAATFNVSMPITGSYLHNGV